MPNAALGETQAPSIQGLVLAPPYPPTATRIGSEGALRGLDAVT